MQTHQEQKDQKENKVKKKPKEQKDSSGVLPAFVDVAAVEQEEAIADGDATGCDPPETADVPPNMDCMLGFFVHFFAWATNHVVLTCEILLAPHALGWLF